MFKEYISDQNMIDMADEVSQSMDAESLEIGNDLYDRGRVEWTKLFGSRIYSVVDDGKKNTVVIHTDDFANSICACAKRHFCEHIAAVFLHYYEQWLMSKKTQPVTSLPSGRKNLRFFIKNQALDIPITEEGPAKYWHEYFTREYVQLQEAEKHNPQYMRYQLDELCSAALRFNAFIRQVSARNNEWSFVGIDLYQLHSILFYMIRLEKSAGNSSFSNTIKHQVKIIEDDLKEALDALVSTNWQAKHRPVFQEAVELVREGFLEDKNQLFAWFNIYRQVCNNLFDGQQVEEEISCLEKIVKRLKESRQMYYKVALVLANLKMWAQKSDEALATLQKTKEKRIEDLFLFLQILAEGEKWEKLLIWLRWLDEEIKGANLFLFKEVCHYCVLGAKKNREFNREFASLLQSWLPRSFNFYADYLLEEGLSREWVELHISSLVHDWRSVDKGVLRYLGSKDPAALMPLYHQWAARLIDQRKRQSYIEAVRLLKKLRTLYNRQRMGKEWRAFISRLASHYPRLRAFQEELRKGKLIS